MKVVLVPPISEVEACLSKLFNFLQYLIDVGRREAIKAFLPFHAWDERQVYI
jgi:hypothetical protein